MVTIREVAKEARVSVSTASRALASYGYVKTETRRRVLQAAKKLGYHFNTLAKGLRTSRTYSIGYLLPDITNPFYALLAKGIQDFAFDNGFTVSVLNDDNNPKKTKAIFKMFLYYRIEGIIYSTPYNKSLEEMTKVMLENEIPIINCYGSRGVSYSDIVESDSINGCFKATKYLFSLGHKHIAVVTVKDSYISGQRLLGCKKAFNEFGVEMKNLYIFEVENYYEKSGYEITSNIMSLNPRPSAIVTFGEQLAIGVIKWAHDNKFQIPQHFSLVSVDDIISDILSPTLTSVSIPVYEAGKTSAELLLNRINSNIPRTSRKVVLDEKFVVRESTGFFCFDGIDYKI